MIPLHNHSNYSRLDGLATPEDIAKRINELGIEAVGITDHDLVAGHVDFYNTMLKHDIKPILGIEAYQAPTTRFSHGKTQSDKLTNKRLDNFHLILLAKNNEGLRNLWRMNSESHRSGFWHHGRVDWELLEKFHEGIICTSACALSLVNQGLTRGEDVNKEIDKYLNIFGDDFYLELGTYTEPFQVELNELVSDLHKHRSIPVVYGNDAHYAAPEDYELHEATLAVQYNHKLANRDKPYHSPCLYIMSEDDVRDYLCYLPEGVVDEAIDNTDFIASMVNTSLPKSRPRTPIFIPDTQWESSWDMLFDLIQNGFEDRIKGKDLDEQVYLDRIQSELQVISDAKLYDYFMIVRDYIMWAKENGIMVGPGRGSVGGSLVAYLLYITDVDPIKYDLIFERFYNKGRTDSLPDIDVDFSTEGRDRVKEYISKKYTENHVSDLGTVITLKSKGAINDIGRILEVPIPKIREIGKILDLTTEAGIQSNWANIDKQIGFSLIPYKSEYPKLFEWAEKLYDHIRSYGIHASGVIIGDEPLDDTFPLRWVPKDQKMVTQWPMEVAEDFGYMKMDLLSLRTLDTLEELNSILIDEGKQPIDYASLQDISHPDEMWELFDKGLTIGLFQVESGAGARNIAKKLKPRSVEDLAMLLALNRPGPDSHEVEQFLKNKYTGEFNVVPHVDIMKQATKETLGLLVFQEQVINLLYLMGYSLSEADTFRGIIGKKKVEEIEAEKRTFYHRAGQFMNGNQCDVLWKKIESFSKYAFNKAHAIAYAILLLRTLYAKYYYPSEFMLACIRTVDKDAISRYLNEAIRMGIEISPPDINKSDIYTKLEGGDIIFGFADIKYISKSPARWIIQNRPFTSVQDILEKSLEEDRKIKLPGGGRRVGINKRQISILREIGAFDKVEPREIVDEVLQIEAEKEYLGVAFSDKSDMIVDEYIVNNEDVITISEINEDGAYKIAGTVSSINKLTTKDGKPYLKAVVKDSTGELILFVWSDKAEKIQGWWRKNQPAVFYIIKGERGTTFKNGMRIPTSEN